MTRQLLVADLGVMPYAEALELQRSVAAARISGDITEDVLLLLEHPPVVTLGRASKAAHLMSSPEFLASRGVELFEVERGGDVTFHGPGQLVGYPIVDLKRHRQDLHWYLRQVEESLIRTLSVLGIQAERNPGYTGVWTGGRKIASIGVHTRDWVTWHGFALNVATDLSYFDLIVPCGISGVQMTSVEREGGIPTGRPPRSEGGVDPDSPGPHDGRTPRFSPMQRVAAIMTDSFASVFRLEPVTVDPAGLRGMQPALG